MIIKVTTTDIAQGQRGLPGSCPIALAAKRVYDFPVKVGVVHMRIAGQQGLGSKMPYVAVAFIQDFDHGGKVEPFEFEMPDEL